MRKQGCAVFPSAMTGRQDLPGRGRFCRVNRFAGSAIRRGGSGRLRVEPPIYLMNLGHLCVGLVGRSAPGSESPHPGPAGPPFATENQEKKENPT